MNSSLLIRTIAVLLFLFLVISGLYFSRGFLVPLSLAGVLAMLFLPFTEKLESMGMHRVLAILLSILIILLVIAAIGWMLSWQVGNFVEDAVKLKQQLVKLGDKIKIFASKTLGISNKTQAVLMEQQATGAGNFGMAVLSYLSDLVVNLILVLVYFFLLIYLRSHIKKFILMLVPPASKKGVEGVISDASRVGQRYLAGLAMMIFLLWIMYGIGFSLVGVKYALFFAVLCGLLEIVPFVGNLTGTVLTASMAATQGAGTGIIVGVLVTYALVQFLQTYILEPLVVGARVNINPLFTIIVIVLGEMIWGIPGMILAIPLTGILKIILDHIEPLKPYGFLIGTDPKPKANSPLVEKLKNKMRK